MVLILGLSCLLIYLSLGYAWRVFAYVFTLVFFLFFSLPSDQIGGGFLVCYFSSRSLLLFVFVCSDGMEREAYVCDHGLERSDLCVCVCVFSSHSSWTSSSLDVPAGVTQEEGHTGFLVHLLSAVRALTFLARRIQPFLSLVDREVEFCVLTI